MLHFGLNFGLGSGWRALNLTSWFPTDLGTDLSQWIKGFFAPDEGTDLSDNATNIKLVDSVCASLDGVSDELVIASLTGTETVASSGGTSTPTVEVGRVTFTAGTCWELILSNGSEYPLCDAGQATAHDVVGSADGTWNTGAGGLASIGSGRTDAFHYMASNGGSVVIPMNSGAFTISSGVTTGLAKELVLHCKLAEAEYRLWTSDGKDLEVVETIPATEWRVQYDGVNVGVVTGDWQTFTLDVDVSSTIVWGDSGVTGAWEFGYATLADNGGWSGSSFMDLTTVYNMDRSGPDSDFTDNLTDIKQYPAKSTGDDDVDGAGLINKPIGDTYAHNGGVYKEQQVGVSALYWDGANDNVVSGIGPCPTSNLTIDFWGSSEVGATTLKTIYGAGLELQLMVDDALANQYVSAFFGGGTRYTTTPAGSWLPDEFNHVVLRWNSGTTTLSIFINAVPQTLSSTGARDPASTTAVLGRNSLANNRDWEGLTARTRVWETALSDTEIGELFSGGPAYDSTTPPKDDWNCSNAVGTSLPNSGTGLDGVIGGPIITEPIYAYESQLAGDFWGNVTFDKKTYTDYLKEISGENDVWLKFAKPAGSGVCHVEGAVTVVADKEWTPTEFDNIDGWLGTGTCGADSLVPAEVTAGTGIGPDLDWADNGDGYVLFVEEE